MTTDMKTGVYLTCFLLGSFIISSCQREITGDIPTSSNKNSCSGTLLIKLTSASSNDSAVTDFEYDAGRRLIRQTTTAYHPFNPGTTVLSITRDANGMITRAKRVRHHQLGSDSTDSKPFYSSTDHRFTHVVTEFSFSSYKTTDSTVYFYDAAGRLISEHAYLHHFTPGPYYTLDAKYEYTYANDGNVSKLTIYSRDQVTNVIGLEATYEYTYDNKKRALPLDPLEMVIINGTQTSPSQNVTSIKVTNVKFPVYTGTYTEQFTYNSCDMPLTMMETFSASTNYRKLQYFYK